MAKEELAGLLRVYCIDPDSDNFPVSLGISPERVEELNDHLGDLITSEKRLTVVLEKMSLVTKNANELCLVAFILGKNGTSNSYERVIEKLLLKTSTRKIVTDTLLSEGIKVSYDSKDSGPEDNEEGYNPRL